MIFIGFKCFKLLEKIDLKPEFQISFESFHIDAINYLKAKGFHRIHHTDATEALEKTRGENLLELKPLESRILVSSRILKSIVLPQGNIGKKGNTFENKITIHNYLWE